MHEIAMVEELVNKLKEEAEKHKDAKISNIKVTIDKDDHLTPDNLKFLFEKMSKGTKVEGAYLLIEEAKGEGGLKIDSIEIEYSEK
ncbi:MAG: hydrogenase/urease maturation nickel metallochaperone HypA [bacterium]|nr:hydrogenase/urease maturation nickel metallochaperone HypA [bacterium]